MVPSTGVGDDVVGVDAERGPEVCAISVIRQRAETENSAFANIDDTVEDAQADIARGVQRAASRVDITLDNAIGDELHSALDVAVAEVLDAIDDPVADIGEAGEHALAGIIDAVTKTFGHVRQADERTLDHPTGHFSGRLAGMKHGLARILRDVHRARPDVEDALADTHGHIAEALGSAGRSIKDALGGAFNHVDARADGAVGDLVQASGYIALDDRADAMVQAGAEVLGALDNGGAEVLRALDYAAADVGHALGDAKSNILDGVDDRACRIADGMPDILCGVDDGVNWVTTHFLSPLVRILRGSTMLPGIRSEYHTTAGRPLSLWEQPRSIIVSVHHYLRPSYTCDLVIA